MGILLSDHTRLLFLVSACALLWSLESIAPLYIFERHRLRRVLPNISLSILLVVTNLALLSTTGLVAGIAVNRKIGVFFLLPISPTLIGLFGVVALDLFTYFAHVSLHKSRLGWRFHRVHHSDNEVNVTTAFRQHPGETICRILWQMLAVAIFGIPLWVVLVYLMISTLNAQLEHTNIRVNERVDQFLRFLLVTPNMHKVHHSREQIETDSNYSNIFSIWDRLFGTYTARIDFKRLNYGLEGFDDRRTQSLTGLLRLPFRP